MNKDTVSLVSFSYHPRVKYAGPPPYNPKDNPAYNFVWQAVQRLGLGTAHNPLKSIIKAGDSVLIKLNLVSHGQGAYTRPEVVRPIIDMAAAAGAKKIYIGDASISVPATERALGYGRYFEMVRSLKAKYPGIDVQTINLAQLGNGWRWIHLGTCSSFHKSGCKDGDLGFMRCRTLSNQKYYWINDAHGKNPKGKPLGWYAISNIVLNADVIINVPKMKTHHTMIATLSMKNAVGCTMASTYDEGEIPPLNLVRIPHCHVKNVNYFKNDVAAMVLHDLNKIILYCDKNGSLKKTVQRKYLTVIDGIEAMEKSQHRILGDGKPYMRHVVLAGTDPVATDMVACRVMGYDYRCIPAYKEKLNDTIYTIGNYNPEDTAVTGDCLGLRIKHVFEFNESWKNDAKQLAIRKFNPPKIRTLIKEEGTITARISNCTAAHLRYDDQNIVKMRKRMGAYSAKLPASAKDACILAHDNNLNSINIRI